MYLLVRYKSLETYEIAATLAVSESQSILRAHLAEEYTGCEIVWIEREESAIVKTTFSERYFGIESVDYLKGV